MADKMERRKFLKLAATAAMVCAAGGLTGCKRNVNKLVIGDWYLEGSDDLSFTIYDDGTVNIPGTYGTGRWSIVNDDQLKITDFYGEAYPILRIVDIDKKSMTVRQMYNGQESTESIAFYHTAEEAVKH